MDYDFFYNRTAFRNRMFGRPIDPIDRFYPRVNNPHNYVRGRHGNNHQSDDEVSAIEDIYGIDPNNLDDIVDLLTRNDNHLPPLAIRRNVNSPGRFTFHHTSYANELMNRNVGYVEELSDSDS